MPTNREDLIRAAQLARPALAAQPFVKALTHFLFNEDGVTAYNDISAIEIRVTHDLSCCVPGDALLKTLGSFGSKEVVVQQSGAEITVKAGKGKVTLPTLSQSSFPFKWPSSLKEGYRIDFSDAMLAGIERCLVSVGTNPTHPAQMGITLDSEDGQAIFCSTDNFSITKYACPQSPVKLPADVPVLLPLFFCTQLLALSKAFPEDALELWLLPRALVLMVGDSSARLFMRMMNDPTPLDFPAVIKKNVSASAKYVPIPDGWEEALQRSMIVLGGAADKAIELSEEDGRLRIYAKSEYGEHDESLGNWSGKLPEKKISIDPALILRVCARCDKLAFGARNLTLLGDKDRFLHLISFYNIKASKRD